MAGENERTVVLCMDGSYHSELAFDWYKSHIRKDNDYVIIATCFDRHAHGIYAFGTADSAELASQLQRDIDSHKEHAEELKKKLANEGMKGEVFITAGKAGENAIKVAHDRNAAMIVCGARGHGTVRRTIMGSNSEYIMHHADIPVIICRHKPHQNPTAEHKHEDKHKH
ncbi:putative universal stress protein SAUSA300_1656 [Mytilus edulis]|uniref:putative universal stress protein SAUSA300_1656 n=1 Tax=Mytilus edulis TaxID=6550 RepID=UPI0039F0EED5